MKARIPILSFLLLALIFSCKSAAQSDPNGGAKSPAPVTVPDAETPVSVSSAKEEIAEIADTPGIEEEAPSDSDTDVEDDEEEAEEAIEETNEDELAAEPEAPVIEEAQEVPVQVAEESAPEPPPIEPQVEEPQVVQPPAPVAQAEPPPPQVQPPVQVPVQPPAPTPAPPAQQNQVPERTPPRDPPPSPPPFLGPAEPERPPPVRQEVTPPVLPELPSLPRDEAPETPVVFSRVVRMTVGQILEVPFQGTGWVYLGELGNRMGLSYDSRRLDTERGVTRGQSFIFRAETAGTYILKFYRQDFIQDYIINDYVQVIVGEADDATRGRTGSVIDRGRIVAEPRWPVIPGADGSTSETVSPPAGAATETPVAEAQRPDAAQTAAEPASPATGAATPATAAPSQAAASPSAQVISPDEYVRQAKQEFDAGHVEQALAIIDQMKQRYPSGTDEAWWLLGQLYEANSPARDIRQSLECYRTLVNQYPQSSRVDDARRRIAYLERYYLNIR